MMVTISRTAHYAAQSRLGNLRTRIALCPFAEGEFAWQSALQVSNQPNGGLLTCKIMLAYLKSL